MGWEYITALGLGVCIYSALQHSSCKFPTKSTRPESADCDQLTEPVPGLIADDRKRRGSDDRLCSKSGIDCGPVVDGTFRRLSD